MKLEEDGKYYYEVEPKKELEKEDYAPILDKINRSREPIIHTEIISGKKFYYEFIDGCVYVYTDDMDEKDKIKISYSPGQIEFKTKNKTEIRYIFSLEQYYKTLDYFGIKFPWSKRIVLSQGNIKNIIYFNRTFDLFVTIEDITVFDINLSNEKKFNSIFNIKTFGDLSNFVKYYLNDDIEINKYEEKDFININDFNINTDSKFEIFSFFDKINFFDYFERIDEKEYFFTGPSSIGKTITLLLFSNSNTKKRRSAYFNLKELRYNEKYFEIIAYESRHFFDNNEDWENAFRRIINENHDNYFSILCELIKICGEKDNESNIKYYFIFDEITFDNIDKVNYLFDELNYFPNLIAKTNNCHLIGCCSLEGKGVKDILLNQRFSFNRKYSLDLRFKTSFMNYFYEKKEEIEGNKYLKMLGNLPKYINFRDSLNMKMLNLIKKKIKKDIEKFYDNDRYGRPSLSDLEKIDVNRTFDNRDYFKNFLEKIPTQYFIINNYNLKIDYAFPLVKQAINELIDTNKIKSLYLKSHFKKEWILKIKVIDKIKNTNIFGKYYIDNYYEIPTIFRKYKIEDEFFSDSENILLYFSYMNEIRYDCAIYLRNSQILILNKISVYISKNQLEKYNKNNFKKDINEMQKFLKVNNLVVKNY